MSHAQQVPHSRRSLLTNLIVMVLTASVSGAICLVLLEQARQRTEEARAQSAEALALAERKEEEAIRQHVRSLQALRFMESLQNELRDLPELRPLRARMLEHSLEDIRKLGREMAEEAVSGNARAMARKALNELNGLDELLDDLAGAQEKRSPEAADTLEITLARMELVENYRRLAYLYEQARDHEQAARQYQQAWTLLREANQRSNGEALKEPRYAEWNKELPRKAKLQEEIVKALSDIDFALKQKPPSAARLLRERMFTLIHRRQPAEAVATADKLIELTPENHDHLYHAARTYALSISLLDKGMKQQQERYAVRTVGLLQQAHQHGWKDVERIKQDRAFDPLRERDDFQQLLADVEKK